MQLDLARLRDNFKVCYAQIASVTRAFWHGALPVRDYVRIHRACELV